MKHCNRHGPEKDPYCVNCYKDTFGEYKGSRCSICYWSLYDGDWCQGPKWCVNHGKSVDNPIYLSNKEALKAIDESPNCQDCGEFRGFLHEDICNGTPI